MSKPTFQTMSRQELHTYVLAHRDDHEAFYAYVDKLHTEASWVDMPSLQSPDDLNHYPDFLERVRNRSRQDNAD